MRGGRGERAPAAPDPNERWVRAPGRFSDVPHVLLYLWCAPLRCMLLRCRRLSL